jgi:Ca-activated chloride channel homolog
MSEAQYGLISEESQVPLTGVEVHADIAGRSAKVKVLQSFTNAENHPVEAVYRFPLPEGASVCSFSARIDGRVVESEIEEREEAFEMYDDAMMKGHGAYLLDQERPNIFTLSVGNLNPGKSAEIEISYVTLLDCSGGELRFYLPTTISPRYLPEQTPDREGIPESERIHPTYAMNVAYGLKIRVDIHGREQISGVSSPSHAVQWTMEGDRIRVEFSADSVAMDRDFVLTITGKDGIATQGFVWKRADDSFFQVDFAPRDQDLGAGEVVRPEDLDIIFVLDCSGSMQGSSIVQAKKALEIFLKGLGKDTNFNIYTFGSTFVKMAPSSLLYSEVTLRMTLEYLEGVDANLGGTEILAPLAEILGRSDPEGRKRRIVLITDGEVGNEQQVMDLVRTRADSAAVFTVGIGHGPNEHFIKGLARAAGGAAEMIAPGERIEPKVLGLFGKVLGRRIESLKLALGPDCQQAPADGVAFTGETRSLFARVKGSDDLPVEVKVKGTLEGRDREWTAPLRRLTEGGDAIPLLWVREAIRDLEEGSLSSGGSRQVERKGRARRERIIELSKAFGIMSSETSLVAVERRAEDRKTLEAAVLRKVPVMLTKGWHGVDRLMAPLNAVAQPMACPASERHFDMPAGRIADQDDERSIYEAPRMARVSPLARRRPPKTPKGPIDSDAELLMKILSLQRAEGGFLIDNELADLLKISMEKLAHVAKTMTVATDEDRLLLLSTATVLNALETRFAAHGKVWRSVVEKSRKWLFAQLVKLGPKVQGLPLGVWAKSALERLACDS